MKNTSGVWFRWFGLCLRVAALAVLLTGCPPVPPGNNNSNVNVNGNDNGNENVNDNIAPQPLDADGDDVVDEDDLCLGTPENVPVDVNGCADSQKDSDHDGVTDDVDLCAGTEAGTVVDATGCPVPTDSDHDGVPNDDDVCSGTPAGAEIDANGCADSQKDSDHDGVSDDVDKCAQTPEGTPVNSVGCPTTDPDADGDNVLNEDDDCPGTPEGATVDANGCAQSQLDDDNDSVKNATDLCADTPEGEAVNSNGCSETQLDDDNDNVSNADDQCANTPRGARVDANGCPITTGGNNNGGGSDDDDNDGVINANDQCPNTPPNTPVNAVGCPLNNNDNCPGTEACFETHLSPGCEIEACCNTVCEVDSFCCDETWDNQCVQKALERCDEAPKVPNNECAGAIVVNDGTTEFSNIGASIDGPTEAGICPTEDGTADFDVGSDVWFCYTASCTGTAIFSLCGSTYDTTMAVYSGCGCPTEAAQKCSDDDCGFLLDSRVAIPVTQGETFTIRTGGFIGSDDEQGNGQLTIICGEDENNSTACRSPAAGFCTAGNGTPGCDDADCCSTVCLGDADRMGDHYCCDVEWDTTCAAEAEGLCNGSFASCQAGAGSCSEGTGSPGCDDADCCNSVCMIDPYCCVVEWDAMCAAAGSACP